MGIITAVWEKMTEMRHEWIKVTLSAIISPLLYMIAFGWGLGMNIKIDGISYMQFIVPGIISLTTMNVGFSSTSTYLNMQKMFEHSLDQVLVSPTPIWQYVLGQTIGGGLRGVYSGAIIIVISIIFKVGLVINPLIFVIIMLNSMIFSAFGIMAAMISKTHQDVARFSTFVILPMTFLCNTFFSLDKLPLWVEHLIRFLPITHASESLRAISCGNFNIGINIIVMLIYLFIMYFIACRCVYKVRNI